MRDCLEACAGKTWAAWLPLAYLVLSHANGLLRISGQAPGGGTRKAFGWAGAVLDRVSMHARHDGRGTLKVPFTASRP